MIIRYWKAIVLVFAVIIMATIGVHSAIPAEAQSAPSCIYVVQPGDYLSSIGPRVGLSWQRLYALNQSVIGSDPTKIIPGQRLTICDDGRNPPNQPIVSPPPPIGNVPQQWSRQTIIDQIYAVFGVYGRAAVAVADCESNLDPLAYNQIPVYWPPQPDPHAVYVGHAAGVFQIIDGTWASLRVRSLSRYNPIANIQGAWELFQRNEYNWYQSWSCAAASVTG